MSKKFITPFAESGNADAVPDNFQPDGSVSYAEGFGIDYDREYGHPSSKDIPRPVLNGILKDLTGAVGEIQKHGTDTWSPDGAPYPINAQVYHGGKQWLALRANSVEPNDGADWAAIGTAATANLTTSNEDGTAGRVLTVGNGGWMGQGSSTLTAIGYPTSINDVANQTKVIRADIEDNGVASFASGIHFAADNTWGRLRVLNYDHKAWVQGGTSSGGTGWTSEVVLSDNLLQTTGTSTVFPMSQKAVTDQLLGVGQTWQDVTAIRSSGDNFTNTTGKPIMVSVYANSVTQSELVLQLIVDSLTVSMGRADLVEESSRVVCVSSVVPSGSTYRITSVSQSQLTWMELR